MRCQRVLSTSCIVSMRLPTSDASALCLTLKLDTSSCSNSCSNLIEMQGLLDGAALALLADEEWLRLDLAGCSMVDDAALKMALPQLPSLQALNLSGCSATATSLRLLPQTCPNLTTLVLGAASPITPITPITGTCACFLPQQICWISYAEEISVPGAPPADMQKVV